MIVSFPKKTATIKLFEEFFIKVNYQERIDLTADELKIILSQQRTLPNRQKIQAFYWLKAGALQSLTEVGECLGVHRITVHRWLKQYIAGGLPELLKIQPPTGRPRVIPSAVIAGISEKLSEESCDFKTYKEIGKWVENNYQVSVKHKTLHKHLHYRMISCPVDSLRFASPEIR